MPALRLISEHACFGGVQRFFEQACAEAQQALTLHRHTGYDHGYYFVSSFVAEHLAHHAEILG